MNTRIAAMCGWMAAFAAGCAPMTSLTKVWTAENPPQEPLKRVMVLGLAQDQQVRQSFETSAAKALQEKGVEAVASYTVLHSTGTPSKAEVEAAVKGSDVDGVWISRLVGEEQKTQVVPGDAFYPLDSYVAYGYDAVYNPGYVYQYDVVQVETKVFDKDSGQLIWSGVSETQEVGSVNQLIASMSQAVAGDLKKKGLVSAES